MYNIKLVLRAQTIKIKIFKLEILNNNNNNGNLNLKLKQLNNNLLDMMRVY